MEKGLIVHMAIINNNKLLILRRAKGVYLDGFWDIPGGTLEDEEIPDNGVLREVLEETGLRLTKTCLFYCYSNIDQKKNKQFITLVFLGKTSKKNIKINPKEHDKYLWIKLDDIVLYKTVDYLNPCIKYLKGRGQFN